MSLKGKYVGVAFTGSFCTYEKVFAQLKKLTEEGAIVQTIFSNSAQTIDSRFGPKAHPHHFRSGADRPAKPA